MEITIIATNGMLSTALTKGFYANGNHVHVYGLDAPYDYPHSTFTKLNLLENKIDYEKILKSDLVIYTAGAGVKAHLNTDPSLMYALNVNVPVEMTIHLKKRGYKGKYISFGSYMEIGLNEKDGKAFSESEVVCSNLPVTNDYALSKRLYSRYMNDFIADFKWWHFILPNMFSNDDNKTGSHLIPYVLSYLRSYNKGDEQQKPTFSAGLQTRQYILQEDIQEVIERSIKNNIKSGIYNVGGGEFMSIRHLIERLFKLYSVPCEDSMFGKEVRRDGDIKSLRLDSTKLFDAIHFLSTKKIEEVFAPEQIEITKD